MAPGDSSGEPQVVTISYEELTTPGIDLSAKLEAAWGPEVRTHRACMARLHSLPSGDARVGRTAVAAAAVLPVLLASPC